jgi:hypothetical protein
MQKYAVIVWTSEDDLLNNHGTVYGWYVALATALNTATNLMQHGSFWHAVAVKLL